MTNSSSKTALVTGASRGIGAATLAALGQAGYRVIGTATSAAGVAAIEQASADYGGVGVLYNASEREQATALATSAAVEASAGVDVLVINAGITADALLLRMKEDDWARVLEVNLTSVFLLSQAMIRAMMKKRWGRIIIISSVVASTGNAGQANYCAAKAGLEGYCRALAREVASRNITVNAVAPGFIQTDMTEQLPAAIKEHLIANTPLGRMGSPQDVAAAVLYLASAGADYVTGQVLHVNGGMYMG